ncbi:carbohydrate-binding family 9-like protein [Desulfatiferula olefinivorans]
MTDHPALTIPRIDHRHALTDPFDQGIWAGVPAQTLDFYMGDPPRHRPLTRFKIAWDTDMVLIAFEVHDRYVLARGRSYQAPVCRDSCVEFFFTPGSRRDTGYFNLEINCGGTGLFEFHPDQAPPLSMPREAFDRIGIRPELPAVIDPEIPDPLTWRLTALLPVDILRPYGPVTPPRPGAVWRGNIYKCADHSSHPHWLTWAPVLFPRPRFHLPQWFGDLVFA